MQTQEKPKIKTLVSYFKEEIPGCAVTDGEVDELRKLYPDVTYKDLNRTFHGAIKHKAMQPVSYMVRQLIILRPPSDPFNSQVNQRTAYGRKVETGTDWDTIYAELARKREKEKQDYDRVHGSGAYEQKFKEDARQMHQFFVDLEKKYSMDPEEDQKQATQPDDPKADAKLEKLIQDSIAYPNKIDREKTDPAFAEKQRKIEAEKRGKQ